MKRTISMILAAVLMLTLMPAALAYSDVPKGAWYEYSAKYCENSGIMLGTSDDTFSPDANMTRGMFVTALCRMSRGIIGNEVNDKKTADFKDVPESLWCAEAVNWASGRGITLGVTEELFMPSDFITREQIACMIARYAEYIKAKFTTAPELIERYKDVSFKDADSVSDFAKDGVALVRKTCIMRGDKNGNFRPHDYVTRAEAAAVFERLYETLHIYDVWTSADYLIATEEQIAQLVSLMSGMKQGEYAEYLCDYEISDNCIFYKFKVNDPTHVNVVDRRDGKDENYGLDDPTGEISAQIWEIINTLEVDDSPHW